MLVTLGHCNTSAMNVSVLHLVFEPALHIPDRSASCRRICCRRSVSSTCSDLCGVGRQWPSTAINDLIDEQCAWRSLMRFSWRPKRKSALWYARMRRNAAGRRVRRPLVARRETQERIGKKKKDPAVAGSCIVLPREGDAIPTALSSKLPQTR